jgi:hypothetical protein
MSAPRWNVLLATVVAVVVALTGCVSPEEPSASTPRVTEDTTPRASSGLLPVEAETTHPSTPDPTDVTDPGSWLISFDGIGPLSMGGRISEKRRFMTAFTEEMDPYCDLAMFASDSAPDIWAGPRNDVINFMVATAHVDPLPVASGSPRTDAGIGVGSTLDELVAAYPTAYEWLEERTGHQFTLASGDGRWIHFAMTHDDTYVVRIVVNTFHRPPYELCG